MKKTVLFALALALTFTTAYIIFGKVFDGKTQSPIVQPKVTVINEEKSQEQIAFELMEKNLQNFKSKRIDKEWRLTDFKIFKVSIEKQIESGFVFSVIFSVKPVTSTSEWNAKNGMYNDRNGWIEGKSTFVRVLQRGNTYIYLQSNPNGITE